MNAIVINIRDEVFPVSKFYEAGDKLLVLEAGGVREFTGGTKLEAGVASSVKIDRGLSPLSSFPAHVQHALTT